MYGELKFIGHCWVWENVSVYTQTKQCTPIHVHVVSKPSKRLIESIHSFINQACVALSEFRVYGSFDGCPSIIRENDFKGIKLVLALTFHTCVVGPFVLSFSSLVQPA